MKKHAHDPTRNLHILEGSNSAAIVVGSLGSTNSITASGGRGSTARAGVPAIAG